MTIFVYLYEHKAYRAASYEIVFFVIIYKECQQAATAMLNWVVPHRYSDRAFNSWSGV
jgi:hypothetical protein